jgi:hypothetical protein
MAVRRFAIPLMQWTFQDGIGAIRSSRRDVEGNAMKTAIDLRDRHFLTLSDCPAMLAAILED